MNPDTGHLKRLKETDEIPEGYERIKGRIQRKEAKRLLGDLKETFVDDKSPQLAKLANQLRSKNKRLRSKAKKKKRAMNRKAGAIN
jgi:hypothetical protein